MADTPTIRRPEMSTASWMLTWLPYSGTTFLLSPLTSISDFTTTMNLVLLAGFTVLRNWSSTLQSLQFVDKYAFFAVASGVTAIFGFIRLAQSLQPQAPAKETSSNVDGLKPLFFPSKTTHTRLFPKKHAFGYSYLLAGIPIGWKGSVGGILSCDVDSSGSSFGSRWYTVNAEDYLTRGYGHLGFKGKLRKYLESQDVNPDDYPYAYLMTAPKLFGYSFNPVSFWYLYNADRQLSAMILEVNNTFDERRLYFVKPDPVPVSEEEEKEIKEEDEKVNPDVSAVPEASRKPPRFTNSWTKDFHVSPFSSRKGSYSFIAYDPLFPAFSGTGPVNSTIILKSSKAHVKVNARIFSTGPTIDPTTMTFSNKVSFLASWWWVGFSTFPRVIKEAALLFFKRKLSVFYRPEPMKETVSRVAEPIEKALETTFRGYLRHLVSSASSPIVVKYSAAGIVDTEETMVSLTAASDLPGVETLDIKILTPLFYTRFVHYAHDLEALCCESMENNTIYLSRPDLLPKIVLRRPSPALIASNATNYFVFNGIRKLRKRPAKIEAPPGKTPTEKTNQPWGQPGSGQDDIRSFRMSGMDAFVLSNGTPQEQRIYSWNVLKLFISDRVAFSDVGTLRAEMLLLRCAALWWVAGKVAPFLNILQNWVFT